MDLDNGTGGKDGALGSPNRGLHERRGRPGPHHPPPAEERRDRDAPAVAVLGNGQAGGFEPGHDGPPAVDRCLHPPESRRARQALEEVVGRALTRTLRDEPIESTTSGSARWERAVCSALQARCAAPRPISSSATRLGEALDRSAITALLPSNRHRARVTRSAAQAGTAGPKGGW